jgi:hypothetical protein
LEKNPLLKIPLEPAELLDKTRYQVCKRLLSAEKEERIRLIVHDLSSKAAKRGILVKPFFEDASRDPNSVRLVNHVTPQQFKQVRTHPVGLQLNANTGPRRCCRLYLDPWQAKTR